MSNATSPSSSDADTRSSSDATSTSSSDADTPSSSDATSSDSSPSTSPPSPSGVKKEDTSSSDSGSPPPPKDSSPPSEAPPKSPPPSPPPSPPHSPPPMRSPPPPSPTPPPSLSPPPPKLSPPPPTPPPQPTTTTTITPPPPPPSTKTTTTTTPPPSTTTISPPPPSSPSQVEAPPPSEPEGGSIKPDPQANAASSFDPPVPPTSMTPDESDANGPGFKLSPPWSIGDQSPIGDDTGTRPVQPNSNHDKTPAMKATSSSSSSSDSSNSSTVGLVVGLLAAGLILVLIAIIFVMLRRKRKEDSTMNNRPPPSLSIQLDGNYYRPANPMGFSGQSDSYISGSSGPVGGGNMPGAFSGPMSPGTGGPKSWFTYEELLEVTNGFSQENILGEGGFGCVYKGTLPDGRLVAVKELKAGSGQGEREFMAEVEIISRVHHRHLVSLVGYCIAEYHRLLVYEFLPNNTLEQHLHGLPVMDWSKRMRIAIGSAKGLAYLHEDCHPKVIHRDIKSANILLEDTFEPQVADFGLAKPSNDTNTHVSTRVMGTFGYMAPEYASTGKLTDRSDVFSFGVVLLEIITGRKPVDGTRAYGDESLVEWARPLLVNAIETGNCDELVDPRLEGNYNKLEMFKMIEAAAACVRHSAPKRPRMVQVVRALDCQDSVLDLSNGTKYGQSQAFNPGQPNADMQKFRAMAFGGESGSYEFDSGEYDRRSAAAFSGEHKLESDTRSMFQSDDSSSGGNNRYNKRGGL